MIVATIQMVISYLNNEPYAAFMCVYVLSLITVSITHAILHYEGLIGELTGEKDVLKRLRNLGG